MSYNKVYPKIGDEILPFDKGQEDRTEEAIKESDSEITSLKSRVTKVESEISDSLKRITFGYDRNYLSSVEQWRRPLSSTDVPTNGMITFNYVVQNAVGKPVGTGEAIFTVHNNSATLAHNPTTGTSIKMSLYEGRIPQFHHNLGYDIFLVFNYSIGT